MTLNRVAAVMQQDMNFPAKPDEIPLWAYLDMTVYSALSEWIRAITMDVDPMMGSNKVGVTRDYLEDRGADTLRDLAATVLNTDLDKTRAKELTAWMVDKMLDLSELWTPYPGNVMCMPMSIVGYHQGHARLLGTRGEISKSILQAGMCHYFSEVTPEDEVEKFEASIEKANKLIENARESDMEEEQHHNQLPGKRLSNKLVLIKDVGQLSEKERTKLLPMSWPIGDGPMQWHTPSRWLQFSEYST